MYSRDTLGPGRVACSISCALYAPTKPCSLHSTTTSRARGAARAPAAVSPERAPADSASPIAAPTVAADARMPGKRCCASCARAAATPCIAPITVCS